MTSEFNLPYSSARLLSAKSILGLGFVLRLYLGIPIVIVKNSYGQTIKFLERMTIIGSNVMKLFLASVLTTSSR
ncbi:MAG: hypothetical protein WBY28_04185 [Nitrososphaeraceae archaeon]